MRQFIKIRVVQTGERSYEVQTWASIASKRWRYVDRVDTEIKARELAENLLEFQKKLNQGPVVIEEWEV